MDGSGMSPSSLLGNFSYEDFNATTDFYPYLNGTFDEGDGLTSYGRVLFRFKRFYVPIHGYLAIIVCVFGMITNFANIIVLTRKAMLSATNSILTGLAVADMLVMIDYVPFAYHTYIHTNQPVSEQYSYNWAVFTLVHAHLSVVMHTVSTWLTVVLAIWRYLSVRFPTESRNWLTMKTAHWTILSTYIVVTISCIPVYLCFKVKEELDRERMTPWYRVSWSDIALQNDGLLKQVNFWVFSVGTKLVPCILLTYLSWALVSALLEAEKRKKRLKQNCFTLAVSVPIAAEPTTVNGATHVTASSGNLSQAIKPVNHPITSSHSQSGQGDRTTRMLIAVLLLFLITETPNGIIAMLSGIVGEVFFNNLFTPLGELFDILALINSAVNFILYCTMSKQFRQTFSKLFFL